MHTQAALLPDSRASGKQGVHIATAALPTIIMDHRGEQQLPEEPRLEANGIPQSWHICGDAQQANPAAHQQ
jgi:hypothetical protein